jgi:SAM-dependent methyltransferase
MAARFQRVIATDLSAAQIAHAPPLPNVEWRVAHAEDSGIGAASVSLITVAQALHWFDLPRFWQEARRVLMPRGVVAVWSYGVFVIDPPEIAAICQHFYEDIVGPFWPPERRIVEAGYGALDFPFDEIPAPSFQMQAEWSLDALLGYLCSWSATSRHIAQLGTSPIPDLRERLSPHWPSPGDLTIRWPLSIRVGRV